MIELQFQTEEAGALIDLVRQAGAQEGSHWSRRKVATWIGAGCVRVDDEVVRDPRAPIGAATRIDLCVDATPRGLGAAGHAPASAPLPLLHVDRHLLVVELLSGAEDDPAKALRQAIEKLGLSSAPPEPLVHTAPPDAACTGIVACALTASAAASLHAARRRGEIRVGVAGRAEPLVLGGRGRLGGTADPAAPPHIVRLELPHPRTGAALRIELES